MPREQKGSESPEPNPDPARNRRPKDTDRSQERGNEPAPQSSGPIYGQRLAVSSQPAARTGCGATATAGPGMRIGCCGPFTAVANAGFTMSEFISFSSE